MWIPGATADAVLAQVAALTGVAVADLRGTARGPHHAFGRARMVARVALLRMTKARVADVCRAFGCDHSTVINSLARVEAEASLSELVTTVLRAQADSSPTHVAMNLTALPLDQRRQVACYLTALLADRPRWSPAALAGLKILATCTKLVAQVASALANTDTLAIPRCYWRDSTAGIAQRIAYHAAQAGYGSRIVVPPPPPLPLPPPPMLRIVKENAMPRIELIEPASIPTPKRNNQAVSEAAEWLARAAKDGKAVVVRLDANETIRAFVEATTEVDSMHQVAERRRREREIR
jgi:hypothetical protein